MANTYKNKVIYNGTTLVDLTEDTATAADVAEGKTFHLASGEQAVGTASGSGGGISITNTNAFLAANAWFNNVQYVTVEGVTEDNTIIVTYAPDSRDAYADAGVMCVSQSDGMLEFSCETTPTGTIEVYVMIIDGAEGDLWNKETVTVESTSSISWANTELPLKEASISSVS